MVKKIIAQSYVWLILLLLYMPIMFVIAFSFTRSSTIGQWNGFSLELYSILFKNAKLMEAVKNTFVIAFLASSVATALGSIAAIGIYYSRPRVKTAMLTVSQVPVVNADIVTAVSLSLLFLSLGVGKGFTTLLISHITFCTPYVVLSVLPKLKQMNPSMYEAALDLGATPGRALWKVVLPEIVPGMVSGFLLSFTLSVDDFVVTVYNTMGYDTLSKYIYDNASKAGIGPELRALSAIIFIFTLTVLLVYNITSLKKQGIKNTVALPK